MVSILSVSTHPEILAVMNRLVNQREGWTGAEADSLTTASRLLRSHSFDILLLGTGIDDTAEAQLQRLLDAQGQPCRIVRHFGGGSGLLLSEIMGAANKV